MEYLFASAPATGNLVKRPIGCKPTNFTHPSIRGYNHSISRPRSLHAPPSLVAVYSPLLLLRSTAHCNRRLPLCSRTMDPNNTPPVNLILGSASISRKTILAEMGYEFSVVTADIDEKAIRKEKPEELVMALAEAKADAIITKLQSINHQEKDDGLEPIILIAADTVVVYDDAIREKPSNEEEARQFMKDYSGSHAATVGSVLVTNLKTGVRKGGWDRVEIYFHEIPNEVIEKLVEEGSVLKTAGGLIIEHPLIVPYVKEVVGTTDSVMGLPKALTEKLLKEVV
ncbi:7-methyl-GTP pyrophosphatase [Linum perenne]